MLKKLSFSFCFLMGWLFFGFSLDAQSWEKYQEAQYLEKIQGDFKRATELYEELIQQSFSAPLAHLARYRRAFLLEMSGQIEVALEEYEVLSKLEIEPASTLAFQRLKWLRFSQSQSQQKQIEQLTQTIEKLTTKLQEQPLLQNELPPFEPIAPLKDPQQVETALQNSESLRIHQEWEKQQAVITHLQKTVLELEAKLKTSISQTTLPEKNSTSPSSIQEQEKRFNQKRDLFFLRLEAQDFLDAQHILDEMEQDINEYPETTREFQERTRILLTEFHRKLQIHLEKKTQQLAQLQKEEPFRKKAYKEYAYLTEWVVGEGYTEKQIGENGFPDLHYQLVSIPKQEGPEKLIQLIKRDVPIPPESWSHSQAFVQFQQGFLVISQQPEIRQMILSFLNSLGNPRARSLQLSCILYNTGELDPFMANLPGSKITLLKDNGYGAQLTSQETQNFEKFLLRSGLPRFKSKHFPLQHLRESTCTLQKEYKVVTGYLPIQNYFREITETLQYGISLNLIPLCHHSGNLTLSVGLKNQILALPVERYMTERGMIHLPHIQTQKTQQSWFFFEEGQSLIVLGLKNPFPRISQNKEHLLLHLQLFPSRSSPQKIPSIQGYDVSDLLQDIPDYPAPRLKQSTEPGLPLKSSFLQAYLEKRCLQKELPLTVLVNGTRLEIQGPVSQHKEVEEMLAQIRAEMDKLIRFQIRVFLGKKETFPLTYLKKIDTSFFSLIRTNGPQTLELLASWGKPFPFSTHTVWAANTQLVHLHQFNESSFISQFQSNEYSIYPKLETTQEGLTLELRPLLLEKQRFFFQTKVMGSLLNQFEEEIEQFSSWEHLSTLSPQFESFQGEGEFELKEGETLILIFSLNTRQLVFWITPQIHLKNK